MYIYIYIIFIDTHPRFSRLPTFFQGDQKLAQGTSIAQGLWPFSHFGPEFCDSQTIHSPQREILGVKFLVRLYNATDVKMALMPRTQHCFLMYTLIPFPKNWNPLN